MTETALTIERTPEIIATEIISIREQTKKIMLIGSMEIGKRLTEAKELVPHGEWGKYLEEKVDYSPRTANDLMRLYKEYGGSQMTLYGGTVDSQAIANLSHTQALALLGVPQHEREEFVQEYDVENMSVRELQAAIRARDEAERKLKEVEEGADQIAEERDKAVQEASEAKGRLDAIQTNIDVLQKQMKEAQESGATPQKVKDLEKSLKHWQKRAEELEKQAAEPVTLEPAVVEKVVEKVPEAVEQELAQLREKAKQLESKAGQSEAALKFRVQFNSLTDGFKAILAALAEIDEADREKYRGAVAGLLAKMQESL